jgi:hypothetical protein
MAHMCSLKGEQKTKYNIFIQRNKVRIPVRYGGALTPVIPALGRVRQEEHHLKPAYLKNKQTNKTPQKIG